MSHQQNQAVKDDCIQEADLSQMTRLDMRSVMIASNCDSSSSEVTSLASTDRATVTSCNLRAEDAKAVKIMLTARQLIADLQDMLNSPTPVVADAGDSKRQLDAARKPAEPTGSGKVISGSSEQMTQPVLTDSGRISQTSFGGDRLTGCSQQDPPLELQACNGLCVVFANYASFHPASTALSSSHSPSPAAAASGTPSFEESTEDLNDPDGTEVSSPRQMMARANQIREAAASIGRLFNSRLEFTVHIHWNKSRRETLRLLRQTATAMSEGGRDCCFVFCLGRGGRDHFEAMCGGSVTLTDILATLAVGQRGRLPPVFVVGELTPEPTKVSTERLSASSDKTASSKISRLNLPSNHLLLWTLGAPEMTDLLVEQLTRTASTGSSYGGGGSYSGNKDAASIVSGIAEWIRRRRNNGSTAAGSSTKESGANGGQTQSNARCSARFVSKLDRLVYLASPDCI